MKSSIVLLFAVLLTLVLGMAFAGNETSNATMPKDKTTIDYLLVGSYLFVLVFVATVPTILDTIGTYWWSIKTSKDPKGISGVTRGTIAVTIIVILGIATIQMMVVAPGNYSAGQINNILSVLAGIVASVSGFYFGGKKE